jgi:outer membrane protein assembly factor BamD (BamD/ComL family)
MRIKTSSIVLFIFCIFCISLYSCKSGKEKLQESISTNEQKLFSDSTKMLDPKVAEDVFKSYQEYAEKYPDDTISPVYLFKAADLANGTRKYKEAVELYRQFGEKYPAHRKAAAALFLQAFSYENNLKDKEKAKLLYSDFLQKYPNHQLAASAKVSLEQLNMGLTDEELVKMFEAKQDSLSKAGK